MMTTTKQIIELRHAPNGAAYRAFVIFPPQTGELGTVSHRSGVADPSAAIAVQQYGVTEMARLCNRERTSAPVSLAQYRDMIAAWRKRCIADGLTIVHRVDF